MRKITAMAFVTLDGVMQAPGGPREDTQDGFKYGGWIVPHFDEKLGNIVGECFSKPFDLLLGRKTYDIFAAHWPIVAKDPAAAGVGPEEGELGRSFDRATKYVATHRPESLAWQNSKALGKDIIASLKEIKSGEGPALLTQGSSQLLHTLFAHDLIDEVRLFTFPILLGRGKRFFDSSALPTSLALSHSQVTERGVICAIYARKGKIEVGSFELRSGS
jgi:dihydrofolate reductase